jgi:hypothetical protein
MAVRYQIVIDCRDPEPLARFWAAALGYEFEPPPEGFATWDDYWRDVGVGEEELGVGEDRIIDPNGSGPRIWFQVVPELKAVKNRLHLDISVSGGRAFPIETRRQRVDAEAERLAGLGASASGHEKMRVCGQLAPGSRSSEFQFCGLPRCGWLALFSAGVRRVVMLVVPPVWMGLR